MLRTGGSSSTITGPTLNDCLLGFYTYHASHRPPRVPIAGGTRFVKERDRSNVGGDGERWVMLRARGAL